MTPDELKTRGLRVKPLEWHECTDGTYHDDECQYEVEMDNKHWKLIRASTGPGKYIGHFDRLEAAKAAAEADHASRIAAQVEVDG